MKHYLALAAFIAAILMPLTAMADTPIKYVWVLDESKAQILANGDIYQGYASCGEPNQRIYNIPYGNTEQRGYTCEFGETPSWVCHSSMCTVASFRYVINPDLTFTSGNTLGASTDIIMEMDTKPMVAYGQSMPVFQAGVSGFVDNPFIKNMVLAVICITLGKKIFTMTWKVLDIFKEKETSEDTLQNASGHSVYTDDVTSDGSE